MGARMEVPKTAYGFILYIPHWIMSLRETRCGAFRKNEFYQTLKTKKMNVNRRILHYNTKTSIMNRTC